MAFYDEYNLAMAYEKPIFTNLVEFIAGGFKIDYSVMRASIINSIKFQLCAALGSDATKNVASFGFKVFTSDRPRLLLHVRKLFQ